MKIDWFMLIGNIIITLLLAAVLIMLIFFGLILFVEGNLLGAAVSFGFAGLLLVGITEYLKGIKV